MVLKWLLNGIDFILASCQIARIGTDADDEFSFRCHSIFQGRFHAVGRAGCGRCCDALSGDARALQIEEGSAGPQAGAFWGFAAAADRARYQQSYGGNAADGTADDGAARYPCDAA